jgi:hypothetical protein
MARRVSFSEDDAGRISKTVRAYEAGNRDMSPIKFRQSGDDGEGGTVRLGKTTTAWAKGSLATITVYNNGTPPNETTASPAVTLSGCVNKFASVATGKWVMLAQTPEGYWYLIAAECS